MVEHGGSHETDRQVALLVSKGGMSSSTVADEVTNRQIAPTILRALGLDPQDLQAVRKENTHVLPGSWTGGRLA